jgi:sirohydrochlorin ferrochelatase
MTVPAALIVAHGSPADPGPQEARLRALAADVAALLPGWRVEGATLAAEGGLEAALEGMEAPLVYPFFMANGWFTWTNLPRRLTKAGARGPRQLAPFGADPDLPGLMAQVAQEAALEAGLVPRRTALLLAAHGSQVSRRSADTTHAMARMLAARSPFARVAAGFVEEEPALVDVARGLGKGICLPFFALRAGHVEDDVPQALAEAGFDGPLLPAIGEHPAVPGFIAKALARAA